MRKIIITIIILILGLTYAVQDEGILVLNPQFSGNDLSIPKSINFQGYLYRDGNPMDTTMNMWFGIYDALSSGTQLFQQTINNVIVTKGWFTVSLDNIPNSVFPVGGPTRYLEVKAPSTGPSLSPRISLVSVGYSYHSVTTDSAEYAKVAPLIRPITPPIYSTEIRDTTIIDTKLKDGSVIMAKINQSGATTGQVIKWTGSAWAPRNDTTGPPSGPAGGDLNGTYPNPTIATNAVNTAKIADGQVQTGDIADGNVTMAKINQSSATTGQVIKWTGSAWAPRNDSIAPPTGPAGGDLTGTYPNPTIANNAVTSAKILDGTIRGVDIAKPCTLQGAASYPDGLLQIRNTGTGHGIRIGPTSWLGIDIDSTGSHGVYVNRSDDAGVLVYRADDGFNVNYADRYGVNVNNSNIDGIHVVKVAEDGCQIEKANANGFVVDSAGDDGVRVSRAGEDGVHVNLSGSQGVSVDSAGWNGFYVRSAYYCGFYVNRASSAGVEVIRAGQDGVFVDSAGNNGIYIDRADNNGVYINSAANCGVYAKSNGSNFSGVYGEGPTGSVGAYGVFGLARNKGVYGHSTYWEGVYGEANEDDATQGYYNGTSNGWAGVRGVRTTNGYGVYYEGGIGGSDKMSTLVKTSKGPVALYAQESPENWFEDFGEGELVNGHCRIELEKLFLETVTISDQYPVKIFIQLRDDCNGVYVKTDTKGFDVYELQKGSSNASFTYRVVAKRKGLENLRLKTEEIGYTDQQLYPDLNDPQIPAQIRAKRLEEIENRKKEDEMPMNNQLEKNRREEKPIRLEKR